MAITTIEAQQLYIAYFGRPADPAGQNFWTQAGSTNTMEQQSNAFATAPEWTSAIAGMTNDQIVNLIYINCFGRSPEPAGLRFWSDAITDGTLSVGDAAWMIVSNTGDDDAAIVAAKVEAAIGYTAAVAASTTDSVAYGNSAAFASANSWLSAITTSAQATAALVPATLDASLASMVTASNESTATTYNLTTSIDTINVTVSGVNNVASGLMSQTAGESTLNTGDTINGNGLTTVSLIIDAGTTAVQPIADINNVASININLASSATNADGILNMAEFDSVAQVAITQGTNNQVLGITEAQLDTTYAINIARTVGVAFDIFEDVTGATDSVNLAGNGAGNSTGNATFDLNSEAVETVSLDLTGTSFVTVQGLAGATAVNVSTTGATELIINGGANVATYTVTGSGANDITIGTAAAAMTLDFSGTTGSNEIRIGSLLSSLDVITGGTGVDELYANANAGTTRATITGVENFEFDFGTAGATQDLRNVTGAVELELYGDEDATITRAAATIQTINLEDETNTENSSVTYASGSNSAVTLNIGAINDDGDASVDVLGVTLATNIGALTINSMGDAANTAASITADDVSALTVVTTVDLDITGAGSDISAASATDATFTTAGGDLDVDDDVILTAATNIELNALNGLIAIAGSLTSAEANVIVTLYADGGNASDIEVTDINVDDFTHIIADAVAGSDIIIGDIDVGSTTALYQELCLTATEAGSTIVVEDVTGAVGSIIDLVEIVTDVNGDVDFIASDANLTITEIDATGSAGDLFIDLNNTMYAGVDVSTGSGTSFALLTDNADTFVGGTGEDEVWGMDGADDITLGGGSNIVGISTNATTDSVGDFDSDYDAINLDFSLLDGIAGVTNFISGDGTTLGAAAGNGLVLTGATDISSSGDNLYILSGATFANTGAVQTALEAAGAYALTLDNAAHDVLTVVYQDTSGNVQIASLNITTANTAGTIASGDSAVADMVTLVGVSLADLGDANFAYI